MSVVATSVFLLFALIVLGFILGKRNIIHKRKYTGLVYIGIAGYYAGHCFLLDH